MGKKLIPLSFLTLFLLAAGPVTHSQLIKLRAMSAADLKKSLPGDGWKLVGEKLQTELSTAHWGRGGESLVLEYGEGYENTLIYQTGKTNEFAQLIKTLGLDNLKNLYKKETGLRAYQAYQGPKDQVLIIGTPAPSTSATPALLIVTTTDNLDALWFESAYLK